MHYQRIGSRIGLFLAACAAVAVAAPSEAAAQEMQYPLAVAAAKDGTLYVADRNLPGIWKVQDGKPEIYFQGSKKFRTPLNAVRCVTVDQNGRLLAGDSATREVYRFDDQGQPVPLTAGKIGIPMAIAVDSKGDLFVADLELHRIWKVPGLGGDPEEFAEIAAPRGMTIDAEDKLWIAAHGENQIIRLSPDKSLETVVEGQPFQFSHHIVVGADGTAYVADGYAKAIWKIASGAAPEKLAEGEPFKNPVGLALRGDDLIVADPHQKALFALPTAGGEVRKLTP